MINGIPTAKADNNYFLQYDKKLENDEKYCNDFAYALMKEGKRCDKIMEEVENNLIKTGDSKTYSKLYRKDDDDYT